MENLNLRIFQFFFGLSGKSPVLDNLGIFLAEYLPYFLVIGALFFLFFEKSWRKRIAMFSEIAATIILSWGIIAQTLKFLYFHPRPPVVLRIVSLITESGNSFPSGHASFFFALATAIYCLDKNWGKWYLVLAVLNGIARVFVGVHWPFDILAGAIFGIVSGIVVNSLFRPYLKEIEEKTANKSSSRR